MRRIDRAITDHEAILQILQRLPVGNFAMVDNGEPYSVTMNYVAEDDGANGARIFIHGALEGRKAEIWQRAPQVYFFAQENNGETEITLPTGRVAYTTRYASVAGLGTIRAITDPTEKLHRLAQLTRRFFPNAPTDFPPPMLAATAVWEVHIPQLTGKSNPPMKAPMP